MPTKLRLAGVIRESIVDGPGIRMVVFTQGCPHGCPGCQNPETHPMDGGYYTTVENILEAVKENPMLQGVTLSGGDPFMQAGAVAELARESRKLGLNVITYTGYTVERLLAGIKHHPEWKELLEATDTLVDGPFLMEQKSLSVRFRGSTNQRVIDPRASLLAGKAIEKEF